MTPDDGQPSGVSEGFGAAPSNAATARARSAAARGTVRTDSAAALDSDTVWLLYQAAKSLGGTFELERISELAGALLNHAASGTLTTIFLLNPARNIALAPLCTVPARAATTSPVPLSRGDLDALVALGAPLLLRGAEDDRAFEFLFRGTAFRPPALLVPLYADASLVGVALVALAPGHAAVNGERRAIISALARNIGIAVQNSSFVKNLEDLYLGTIRALSSALGHEDDYARGHADRVAGYCQELCDRLGVPEVERKALLAAAHLAQIGKAKLPESIRHKRGGLTTEEVQQVRQYPVIGAEFVGDLALPWDVQALVRHHHEHYDGGGYPDRLVGAAIPRGSRILGIVDAYCAMVADRPYRVRLTRAEAMAELLRQRGAQFDPVIVDVFCQLLDEEVAPPPA